ncbi:MAG: hypothetical protein UHY68_05410 [Acutalibacteraceae bacterium]|nr:hypothetical protein [Acutalibacteraceae bacterium]
MKKKERQSGIELLRIIAMLQIIYLHLYQYGGLRTASLGAGELNGFITTFIWSFCRAPVDLFIMITGYFMITAKFDIKKTAKRAGTTYGAMIFYSIGISVIYFIINPDKVNAVSVAKALFPLTSKTWYFLSNYIVILLLTPFINRMLVSLTKKQYLYFVGIIFFVMSIWSTLAGVKGLNGVFRIDKIVDPYYGKSLGGFLLCYFIGGYLRLFVPCKRNEYKQYDVNIWYLILFILLCITDLGLKYTFEQYSKVFGMFNNPLVVFEAVFLILFFRDFKFTSKYVNLIAGTTLGIYAIHEHAYVREWLWKVISFKDKSLYDTPLYLILVLLGCVVVFVGCGSIEFIRLKIFGFFSKIFSTTKDFLTANKE